MTLPPIALPERPDVPMPSSRLRSPRSCAGTASFRCLQVACRMGRSRSGCTATACRRRVPHRPPDTPPIPAPMSLVDGIWMTERQAREHRGLPYDPLRDARVLPAGDRAAAARLCSAVPAGTAAAANSSWRRAVGLPCWHVPEHQDPAPALVERPPRTRCAPPRCSTSARSAVSAHRPGRTPRRSTKPWTRSPRRPGTCSPPRGPGQPVPSAEFGGVSASASGRRCLRFARRKVAPGGAGIARLRCSVVRSAPAHFEPQALLAPGHRPMVVGGEGRLEQPAQPLQQRLACADVPVVGDLDLRTVLGKGPAARSPIRSPSARGRSRWR